jgi:glycosyltransferase involved in cell wall biosynthesis
MRRILHFAQDSDTSGFFPQLARWHDRGRYQMIFGTLNPIAPWLRDYMESQGVECFSCDCRGRLGFPRGLVRLARLLRRRQVDVLHTHLFEPSVVGLWAGVLARTPLRVMTRHYSDYHTRIQKKWHVRVDQMCNRLAHRIIAVSRHTAEHLVQVEGAPSGKVFAIHNGIDFDRVKLSAPDAPSRLRQEFAGNGAHLLLIAARLHPEKGYDHLFPAVARLKEQLDRPFRLLVAGTGPLDGHYRAQVAALGLQDVVRFLGFRKDLPDLMAAADLFVLPSTAEAFGLVLAEALYLGTPVVTTRVGGIPEIVEDGADSVLVPPGDAEALTNALAGLLRDPDRRRRMAGAGRQRVVERFGFQDMVRSYEAVYGHWAAGFSSPATAAISPPSRSETPIGAAMERGLSR